MPDKKQFIEEACSGIRDRRTRNEVAEELSSHIADKAEDYVLYGEDPEEAERRAVGDMGDVKKLSRELAELHSFFPLRKFRTSLILFLVGFLLVSFRLDAGWFDDACAYVGNILLLVACFNLKSGNRLLFGAFALSAACFAVTIANDVLFSFPPFEARPAVGVAIFVTGIILSCARMLCFGYGVARVAEGKAAKRVRRTGWLYIASYADIFLAFAMPLFLPIFIVIFVVFVLLIAIAIGRANADIWRNDREVALVRTGAMCKAVLCVVIALSVATSSVINAILSTRAPQYVEYAAQDVAEEDAVLAEEVKERILEDSRSDAYFAALSQRLVEDVAESDLLRLSGDEVETDVTYYNSAFGRSEMAVFALHVGEDGTRRVTALSYFAYEQGAEVTGAVESYYAARNATIVNTAQYPLKFVNLCKREGTMYTVVPEYEYVSGERAGQEYKSVRGGEVVSGYVIFDMIASDGNAVGINANSYVHTSPVRLPYNYEIIEKDGADVSGWQLLSYGLRWFILPESAEE